MPFIFLILAQKFGTCSNLAEADELGLCQFNCMEDAECTGTKKCVRLLLFR